MRLSFPTPLKCTKEQASPPHLKAIFIKLSLSPRRSNESASEVSSSRRGPSPWRSFLEEGDKSESAFVTTPCVTGQRLSTLSSQLIPGRGGRDYNLQFTDDGSEALLGGTEKVTQLEGSRARSESEMPHRGLQRVVQEQYLATYSPFGIVPSWVLSPYCVHLRNFQPFF